MNKKALSIILALSCCLGASATAMAQTPEPATQIVSPRMDATSTIGSNLDISGGTAKMQSSVHAKAGTTKISITHVLQKKSGGRFSNVSGTQKSKSSSNRMLTLSSSTSVSGGTYRLKTTITTTGSYGTDTETRYSDEVSY